jgi:transcriptional antiterminator RfaH
VNIVPARRWYVVQTRPRAEGKAVAHLARQGFETYLPRYLKKRRHARRVETVLAPLFPRYLFVAVDMATQRWRSIGSTFGVTHLVCNGEDPAPIADDVIAALRQREDEGGFVRLPVRPRFAAGDKVRLLDGAFADCIGLFEGMKEIERVSVLLDLLGRKVRVLLDADSVAAA